MSTSDITGAAAPHFDWPNRHRLARVVREDQSALGEWSRWNVGLRLAVAPAWPTVLELRSFRHFTCSGTPGAPIIRHLAHPHLADCVHHVPACDQNIDPPQLRDDLFRARIASLPLQSSLMSRTYFGRNTSMGADQLKSHGAFSVTGDFREIP